MRSRLPERHAPRGARSLRTSASGRARRPPQGAASENLDGVPARPLPDTSPPDIAVFLVASRWRRPRSITGPGSTTLSSASTLVRFFCSAGRLDLGSGSANHAVQRRRVCSYAHVCVVVRRSRRRSVGANCPAESDRSCGEGTVERSLDGTGHGPTGFRVENLGSQRICACTLGYARSKAFVAREHRVLVRTRRSAHRPPVLSTLTSRPTASGMACATA